MVVDSMFIKGSDSSIILLNKEKLDSIKICVLSTDLTYYDKNLSKAVTISSYTPITGIPNDIVLSSGTVDDIEYEYVKNSDNYIQYDNTVLDNSIFNTLPIKNKLKIIKFKNGSTVIDSF
jgi:hypothetical protein